MVTNQVKATPTVAKAGLGGVGGRRKHAGAFATAVALSAGLLAGLLPVEPAVAYHGRDYSRAYESNPSTGNYTGVRVRRYDRNIAATNTCDNTFTQKPIYQTQWLPTAGAHTANNFIELGTMHKQSTCKYWFVYGKRDGVEFIRYRSGKIASQEHVFQILRGGDGRTWSFIIDATTVATYDWPTLGYYAIAGLESYDYEVTISTHGYYDMHSNVGGPWYPFNGDGGEVNPPTCGGFAGSMWQAGQHVRCTYNWGT